MINCKNDNILVNIIPYKVKTKLYIPPQFQAKMKHLVMGEVISAGEGTELLPMPVKAGNTVVCQSTDGFDVEFNGKTYRVIKNYNIICAK
jgi:co-chaperonin GroES (HSP10)